MNQLPQESHSKTSCENSPALVKNEVDAQPITGIPAEILEGDFRPFIILARSRTGSNLLASLLNSHPQIRVRGEVLAKLADRSYEEVLIKAFTTKSPRVKARGFKIFYYHPMDDNSNRIWNFLTNWQRLHVVHLKRRNILRTLASRKIAGIQDTWTKKSSETTSESRDKPLTISFRAEELLDGFEQTRTWEEWGDDTFRNHSLVSVNYEDLETRRSDVVREIVEFLGVKDHTPETTLQKQNTRSLRDLIENYDELKSEFSDTTWASFFDE